jgi:hypothetical protein
MIIGILIGMLIGALIFLVGFSVGRLSKPVSGPPEMVGGKCECGHTRSVHRNGTGPCSCLHSQNGKIISSYMCACNLYIRQTKSVAETLKEGELIL